jgi:cytochrome P450
MHHSPLELTEIDSYAFEKPAEGKGVMSRVLGDAIFIADGEAHRRLRKLLQPLYRFPDIKAQYAIFWSKGIELNTAIEREAASIGQGRLVVSMSDFATRATTDAVGQIIMGRDLRSLEKSNELLEAFLALVDPNNNVQMALTALEIFIPNWLRWLIPGGVERRVNSTGVRLRYFCDDFLQSRRREIEEQGPGNDLYTQIIRGGVLSDQELVDNLRETFAAG